MKRLLAYPGVLYDANIIIYYCFYCPLSLRQGEECVVDSGKLTESVRAISDGLRKEGKRIRTIRVIMEEISESVLAAAVKQRVCDEEVREAVGLGWGERFPPVLELQILEKCRKSVRKIESSGWFSVDEFLAKAVELGALKQFYRNVANDPAVRAKFSRKGVMPSDPDLHLIAYSRESHLPVLTDDAHFVALRSELQAGGHVTEVVPVRSIAGPSR